jgi:hypothetical protein
MQKKYALPSFLADRIEQGAYERWLYRKAAAHVRRDRRRGNTRATIEDYKIAIHLAVCTSQGCDFYTGEPLAWELVSTYDNNASKIGGRTYKAKYSLLPTVDHVGDGLGAAEFQICAWSTNDAKSDLSHEDFVALCRRVVAFADRSLSNRPRKRTA